MLRILSAAALTAAGGFAGFFMADKLCEARTICEEIGCLFRRSAFFVTYKQADVYAICRNFKSDNELKHLAFLQNLPDCYSAGEDFRKMWDTALASQKNIGTDERELLAHFGSILGKSDAKSQADAISGLIKELDRIMEIRTENLLKKGRLYRSAGLLFGVMAGIIVI